MRPDPAVQNLVGDWDAVQFEVTSVENPDVRVDLVDLGAEYFINIQPSGGYTSTLSFQGTACTELGSISVRGASLRFRVETSTCSPPRTDSSTFEVDGDLLVLQGETVFDFDLSGTVEEALLEARLDRR